MQINNAREAFERAISNGVLSDDDATTNYAGNFMYMHTEGGCDFFKNIDSRKYRKSPLSVLNV